MNQKDSHFYKKGTSAVKTTIVPLSIYYFGA